MSNKPRCHQCQHPGGLRRRLHANKKPCGCKCHQGVTVKPIPNDRTLIDAGVDAAFEVTTPEGGSGDE